MTVNELIAELQVLQMEGRGNDRIVCTDLDNQACLSVEVLSHLKSYCYDENGFESKPRPIVLIQAKLRWNNTEIEDGS